MEVRRTWAEVEKGAVEEVTVKDDEHGQVDLRRRASGMSRATPRLGCPQRPAWHLFLCLSPSVSLPIPLCLSVAL